MSDVDCVLEPTLVAYIERKKLECLLRKLFKRDIVVYVSSVASQASRWNDGRSFKGAGLWLTHSCLVPGEE